MTAAVGQAPSLHGALRITSLGDHMIMLRKSMPPWTDQAVMFRLAVGAASMGVAVGVPLLV